MDKLDEKHLALFGKVLVDTGVLLITRDEEVHFAKLIEKLYLYVVKEAERDAREAQNK